jgi:hypothetical protein
MQEKALKLILLFLKCRQVSSDKHLVHSVTQRLQGNNPGGIKPSIEHIVRLLSVVPCFLQVNFQQQQKKETILSEVFFVY